ncbi:MAG: ribose-5-phosphate isomerase rki1 [Ramalina farinacea]|uniref:Ribose-5-phosphate isomerase n=1 Tax=Ramalina farinacea TaxID=258253 RepID=A0AA43QH90_9LECA|nr:ribose-5-phosphate isomerase rki1 [Ramalina farinacea]
MSTDIETAKRNAATLAVKDHFPPSPSYIGIGSGSTIVHVVNAIKSLNLPNISQIAFVPTGYQSRRLITDAGLRDIKFDSLPAGVLIDVAFDGADEVDEELNCIKGGGACLYQEKLVATQARKFVCVADYRKLQGRLLSQWPSVPIEVEPLAAYRVLSVLRTLGSTGPAIREGSIAKAGPIKTDQDNFIIDAPFPTLLLHSDIAKAKAEGKVVEGRGQGGLWEVVNLALAIKALEGVLSVGIFSGINGMQAAGIGDGTGGQKPVAAYFGMEDGSVAVRGADEQGQVRLRDNKN